MGVKYHLLRLTRVGPHEEHPAVAEADVRHLHRGRRAIDHYDLMAPVELVGFPWIEAQRHIGRGRCHLFLLGPGGRVSPDRIITAIISSGPEFLEDADAGQSLALGLPRIHRQHLVEQVFPGSDLRQRLNGPLIGELRRTGPDHLAHSVPRYSQLPADLLDRLLVLKIRPPDLRYRLHDQHPTLCSPMTSEASSTSV